MHWSLPSQLHSGPESRHWNWLLQLFPRLQRKPKRQSKTLELIPSLLQRFFRNHHFQVFHFCNANLHSIYLGQMLIFGLRVFFGFRWRVILDLEGGSVNWIFSTCFRMLLMNPVLTFGIWSWTVVDLSFSFLNFIVFESTSVHDCQFLHCFLTRSFLITECTNWGRCSQDVSEENLHHYYQARPWCCCGLCYIKKGQIFAVGKYVMAVHSDFIYVRQNWFCKVFIDRLNSESLVSDCSWCSAADH